MEWTELSSRCGVRKKRQTFVNMYVLTYTVVLVYRETILFLDQIRSTDLYYQMNVPVFIINYTCVVCTIRVVNKKLQI